MSKPDIFEYNQVGAVPGQSTSYVELASKPGLAVHLTACNPGHGFAQLTLPEDTAVAMARAILKYAGHES